MANWEKSLDNITKGKEQPGNLAPDSLPVGYVIAKEPKTNRRSFALQKSVLDALQEIAKDQGTNLNALVNDVLKNYVNEYNGRG